jgi:hypothetical protein
MVMNLAGQIGVVLVGRFENNLKTLSANYPVQPPLALPYFGAIREFMRS